MPETNAESPKERLLRAACDLFYRQGVKATGVDEIIAEAKVAKATFYYHFPAKNDLVRAYLARRHELWLSEFKGWLDRVKRKGLPGIADALELWFRAGKFNGCAFINITAEGAVDEWRERSCRHKDAFREVIAARLDRAIPNARRQKAASAALLVAEGLIVRMQMTQEATAVADGRNLLAAIEAGTVNPSLRPARTRKATAA